MYLTLDVSTLAYWFRGLVIDGKSPPENCMALTLQSAIDPLQARDQLDGDTPTGGQPGLAKRIKEPETLLSFPITELPWQDQRVLVYTKKKGNSRKASILRKAITRVGG